MEKEIGRTVRTCFWGLHVCSSAFSNSFCGLFLDGARSLCPDPGGLIPFDDSTSTVPYRSSGFGASLPKNPVVPSQVR